MLTTNTDACMQISMMLSKEIHVRPDSDDVSTKSLKQVSQAGISNYIPQFTVGCNYLSLSAIPASGNKVLIYQILPTKVPQEGVRSRRLFWMILFDEGQRIRTH